MRTVFTNKMVAHVWAQNNQHYGRSHNGQFYFEGPCLYSYGPHFMVGAIMPNGLAIVAHRSDSPSITTGQHIGDARRAVLHRCVAFLPGLNAGRGSFNHNASALAALARPSAPKKNARKTLVAHLRSAECADMGREDVAAILAAIGSKASPDNVLNAAKKAAARRIQAVAEREQAARLATAREALSKPISAAQGETYPGDARSWATILDRARRAAKAAGWSEKRLDALRARERAFRARAAYLDEHGERERRRAQRQRSRESVRLAIEKVRDLRGSLSTAEAFDRGSDEMRRILLGLLCDALRIQPLGYTSEQIRTALNAMGGAVREAAARRASIGRARREAFEREAFERWLAGENETLPRRFWTDPQGSPYLRAVAVRRDEAGAIVGGRVESSMGADVPLTRAVEVFRFLKLARQRAQREGIGLDDTVLIWRRNGERVPVGVFEVEAVYGDGSFKAGCHSISWRQVERLAKALGVFELEPSDEAARVLEAT